MQQKKIKMQKKIQVKLQKRNLIKLGLISVLLFSSLLYGYMYLINKKGQTALEKPTIKIGATLPLTGNAGIFGNLSKDAINMALEKWQTKETKYAYEVIYLDDMVNIKQAGLNTNRFIEVEGVKAIFSIWGTVDKIVDTLSDKKQVISMSCTLGKGPMSEFVINNETADEEYAKLLLKGLQKSGVKKVALIVLSAKSNVTLGNYLETYLTNAGIEVTDYIRTNADLRDYRPEIAKMQQKNPDYYIMQMGSPGMDIFVKQFMELNPKRNLTSVWNFAELAEGNLPLIENLWFVRGESGSDWFKKEFKKNTGQEPNSCSANSYDNLDMLIWAYENTPLETREVIPNNKNVIKKIKSITDWNGAVGTFSINQNGEVMNKPSMQMYQNGQFMKIAE